MVAWPPPSENEKLLSRDISCREVVAVFEEKLPQLLTDFLKELSDADIAVQYAKCPFDFHRSGIVRGGDGQLGWRFRCGWNMISDGYIGATLDISFVGGTLWIASSDAREPARQYLGSGGITKKPDWNKLFVDEAIIPQNVTALFDALTCRQFVAELLRDLESELHVRYGREATSKILYLAKTLQKRMRESRVLQDRVREVDAQRDGFADAVDYAIDEIEATKSMSRSPTTTWC